MDHSLCVTWSSRLEFIQGSFKTYPLSAPLTLQSLLCLCIYICSFHSIKSKTFWPWQRSLQVGQEWRSSAYSQPLFSIKPSAAGSSLDSSLALTRSDLRTFQNFHSNLGHLSLYGAIIFTLSEWTKCAKIIMLISKRHLLLKYKSNKAKSKFDK